MIAQRVKARQKGVTGYVNAMRPGWLRNPFPLSEYSPEESLRKYKEYLLNKLKNDKDFFDRFVKLKGRTIGCTCKLESPCHVDIIIDVLEKIYVLDKMIVVCPIGTCDWEKEYYGYRCKKCSWFVPFGSEPWRPDCD